MEGGGLISLAFIMGSWEQPGKGELVKGGTLMWSRLGGATVNNTECILKTVDGFPKMAEVHCI